ncbi:hypothetical protein [Candidatus Dormiibacter inghamiae]|uniref:hypothetical protein n=1 Tax=Candidatus Dormiibacter inghamiae TaxID=3127013 RepID=UPI0030C72758
MWSHTACEGSAELQQDSWDSLGPASKLASTALLLWLSALVSALALGGVPAGSRREAGGRTT